VSEFTITSSDVSEGEELAQVQYSGVFGVPGGEDHSPQLSWSGAPEGTKSFGLTCYDPDAPTGSGFWHWAVADLPASTTSLDAGAGDKDDNSGLPSGAFQLKNDSGQRRFIGAGPPPGHGKHSYIFTVHALDVEKIGVPEDATPAFLGFNMWSHTIGTATLTAWAEVH
jgi:hypothetical protein